MKKLYLVDTYTFFFRAYYAIPSMTTKKGLPTQALYGLVSMMIKLLREIKPDYMVCCFDRKEGSFRNELYSEYKSNRGEMPEDLIPQVPYVRQLLEALGVACMDQKGFEADDVIGSLAYWGRDHKLEVVIVSSDKDFAQLISPRITMLDVMKDKLYDPAGVVEKWGIEPEQMIDYLSIVGDSSDNVPGIKGIGPKGAQKLLAEFKDLEGIYNNLDKIKARSMLQKLKEGQDIAYLSKELVTLATSIEIKSSLEDFKLKRIQKDHLKKLFSDLEFHSFERKLFGESLTQPSPKGASSKQNENLLKSTSFQDKGIKLGDKDPKNFQKPYPKRRKKQNLNDSWVERTWNLNDIKKNVQPYGDIWVVLNERGLYLGYEGQAIAVDGKIDQVGAILGPKHLRWKGYGLKEIWKQMGLREPPVPTTDLMLIVYVLRAGDIESFEKVYEKYTGKMVPDLSSTRQFIETQVELEAILKNKTGSSEGFSVLEEIEHPLVPVLFSMETRGIILDTKPLEEQSQDLGRDMTRLEESIHKAAGESFNVGSPKQLAQILFKKMGLPTGKKTKTGYSTGSDVLEKLANHYSICRDVLEYRELSKLKSTYVDALPQLINEGTKRIHTRFRQAATTTGRLSSIHPNLQNIPIRTKRGRLVRRAFVAQKGHQFISADYNQIELRVLAHITEDQGLCKAFSEDLDIHAATASEVFGTQVGDVTPEQRRVAKAVNFGIAYGQGAFGLAEALRIGRKESKEIIENYFFKFKGVKEYMENIVEVARANGYVESLFGRRRYLEGLNSRHGVVRRAEERAAINAPIQGTSSDIVKKAMIAIYNEVSTPMLIQVHDELLFECPEEELEEQCKVIKEVMESVVKLRVPLKVHTAIGKNWEKAHA